MLKNKILQQKYCYNTVDKPTKKHIIMDKETEILL